MGRKSRILDTLTRGYLLEVAKHYEITGLSAKNKEEIVNILAKARSLKMADILRDLSFQDLKIICQGVGVDDSGRRKADLVDRLIGKTRQTRKNQSISVAKKPVKRDVQKTMTEPITYQDKNHNKTNNADILSE